MRGKCPHGNDIGDCEACQNWLDRYKLAKATGDTEALLKLTEEARSWSKDATIWVAGRRLRREHTAGD